MKIKGLNGLAINEWQWLLERGVRSVFNWRIGKDIKFEQGGGKYEIVSKRGPLKLEVKGKLNKLMGQSGTYVR